MVIAVVVGGHVAVLALLAIQQRQETGKTDERMALVFLGPLDETGPVLSAEAARRPVHTVPSILVQPVPDDSTVIAIPELAPDVDWYARGADAAQRAAAEPTTRDFSNPKREPEPRQKKEFGWDKTHTERVHALDGGGIGIHLSDNCELIFAPLPLAGCAFGKRQARGDLFDEMKAPVEAGDWKDR